MTTQVVEKRTSVSEELGSYPSGNLNYFFFFILQLRRGIQSFEFFIACILVAKGMLPLTI